MNAADVIRWLAETMVASSLLIILILAIRRPVAKRFGPEVAYFLWLAPLVRFATPELQILPPLPIADAATLIAATAPAAPTATTMPRTGVDLARSAAVLWALGAALFLVSQFLRQRRFMTTLVGGAIAPSPETICCARDAATRAGLKSAPVVKIARERTGPLVAGMLHPVIILPADFESAYSLDERRLALAHECAHVARGDLVATFAALLFRAAQWPNPIVHFAFDAFRADQEAACDAAVIARNDAIPDVSYAYGRAILKSASMGTTPAASLAMSRHLKERLMLMQSSRNPHAALGRVLAAVLVASGVAATASYSAAAAEKMTDREIRVLKENEESSSVSIISVDDGEGLELEGVEGAAKIEFRNEGGERTVKIWDGDGKLMSEKTYGPGEDMPHKTVVVVGADGKRKAVAIGAEPGHPFPIEDVGGPGERETRVFIRKHGALGEPDCEPMEIESVEGDEELLKDVICIKDADSKDPQARAAALKKAIEHMEASAKREAEHREKVIAKLRQELAAAEKAAVKN